MTDEMIIWEGYNLVISGRINAELDYDAIDSKRLDLLVLGLDVKNIPSGWLHKKVLLARTLGLGFCGWLEPFEEYFVRMLRTGECFSLTDNPKKLMVWKNPSVLDFDVGEAEESCFDGKRVNLGYGVVAKPRQIVVQSRSLAYNGSTNLERVEIYKERRVPPVFLGNKIESARNRAVLLRVGPLADYETLGADLKAGVSQNGLTPKQVYGIKGPEFFSLLD